MHSLTPEANFDDENGNCQTNTIEPDRYRVDRMKQSANTESRTAQPNGVQVVRDRKSEMIVVRIVRINERNNLQYQCVETARIRRTQTSTLIFWYFLIFWF